MTQIMVEVAEDTLKHLHRLAALHPKLTIGQVAGQLLDAQVAYRLEIDRMKSALVQHVGEEWL